MPSMLKMEYSSLNVARHFAPSLVDRLLVVRGRSAIFSQWRGEFHLTPKLLP